jgi:hypothetical protein
MVPAPASAGALAPTIQVTAKPWSQHYTDVGRPGESAGDQYVFTEKLYQHGSRVGRDAVQCVVKRVTKRTFTQQCMGTLTMRGRGDITIQGALTYTRHGASDPILAVTGGTKEFSGAQGQFEVVDRKGPDRYRIYLENNPV